MLPSYLFVHFIKSLYYYMWYSLPFEYLVNMWRQKLETVQPLTRVMSLKEM